MVAAQLKISKNSEKIPSSKVGHLHDTNHSISPDSASANEELMLLRAKNKTPMEALAAVKAFADKETKKKFDMVWFARYRYRYPNHEPPKRIDSSEEYKEDIEKLRSNAGDYHHGFNCGVLAAARMFADQADILHVNELDLSPELMEEHAKHQKKIEEAAKSFPQHEVSGNFPTSD